MVGAIQKHDDQVKWKNIEKQTYRCKADGLYCMV